MGYPANLHPRLDPLAYLPARERVLTDAQVGIDWAGIALERVTGMTLNTYLQKHIFEPLGIKDMSMIPNREMRSRLAYMNFRNAEGKLRGRDHLLRLPLVVDPDNEEEVKRVFNSGGAGMFARVGDYCSTFRYYPLPTHAICNERTGGHLRN
jgi:CubicO group peptidase (beta-lactamase class C family)